MYGTTGKIEMNLNDTKQRTTTKTKLDIYIL